MVYVVISSVLNDLCYTTCRLFGLISFVFELFVYSKWCVCRATGDKDVTFRVLYCGICHSDLHMIKNEWGSSTYPLVPGYVSNKSH